MDEAKLSLAREWLRKAKRDLDSARKLAGGPDPLLDTAIYHCQQAAEKAVKGYLVWRDEPFDKTHDVRLLVTQASRVDGELGNLLPAAELLTPYATAYRYPDEFFEPVPAQFDSALRAAETVYDLILRLAPELAPLRHPQGMDTPMVEEAIRDKFASAGSPTRIPLVRGGGDFAAELAADGVLVSNLGDQPLLRWAVFEETVQLLLRQGGRAKRGDAMGARLGEAGLPLDSVEGHIAQAVYGQRPGDAVFRRITPIACILIWTGVCRHAPGELVLCLSEHEA